MSAVMHDNNARTIEELIATQKPGYSLDQRFYTDKDVYELELERIISRNWILAGHVSELAEPGDFKVLNVAGESAIIVRGEEGDIKAFANVCRHRGSLVCLEQKGNTRKFTCPYHGWMYDIDGNLRQFPCQILVERIKPTFRLFNPGTVCRRCQFFTHTI